MGCWHKIGKADWPQYCISILYLTSADNNEPTRIKPRGTKK